MIKKKLLGDYLKDWLFTCYISSVENGSKLSPSSDFIQQYLLGLFDKNIGITNMYIEKLNIYLKVYMILIPYQLILKRI